MTSPRTFGLIPAAGHSRRMGRPKLTLPLGKRTVLECVVVALREGGVEHVLVIVPPQSPELTSLAQSAGASVLELAEQTPDMRATVERGLAWIEQRFQPRAEDGFLLVPADHPVLESQVVKLLLEPSPPFSIIVPTFEGKRGHPTWIGWRHVAGLRALPAGQGLNSYLRQRTAETQEIPVTSGGVLIDLDTPEDYERLARSAPDDPSGPNKSVI